jgi:hypothetical protein
MPKKMESLESLETYSEMLEKELNSVNEKITALQEERFKVYLKIWGKNPDFKKGNFLRDKNYRFPFYFLSSVVKDVDCLIIEGLEIGPGYQVNSVKISPFSQRLFSISSIEAYDCLDVDAVPDWVVSAVNAQQGFLSWVAGRQKG